MSERRANRDRVLRTMELALGWDMLLAYQKDHARRGAFAVIRELEADPANGKAVERFMHALRDEEIA